MAEAVRLIVTGRVQGVGFRYWSVREAVSLGLDGWVRNRRDGSVEILAAGDPVALRDFAGRCRRGPPAAVVERVEETAINPDGLGPGFVQSGTV